MHRRMIAACVSLALLASACGGERACNDCPDLAGTWELTFDAGEVPAGCTEAQGLPEAQLVLTQVGSGLTGTLGEVGLSGTLFESWNFTLNGTVPDETAGGISSFSLGGRFARGQEALETEDRLLGTYTATYPGDGSCLVNRGYTAVRAP